MKKSFAVGTALVVVAIVGGMAFAEDMVELTGEPVDIKCFMTGKHGPDHAACAKACAEKGEPLGIISKDASGKETLYLVMGSGGKTPKDLLADHMGKQVTVTGLMSEKAGMKVFSVVQVKPAAT